MLNISEIVDKSESMGSSATLEVKDIFKYQVHDFIKDNNEKDGNQRDDGRRDDDRIIHGSINCTGYIPEFTSKITDSGFDFDFGDENNE